MHYLFSVKEVVPKKNQFSLFEEPNDLKFDQNYKKMLIFMIQNMYHYRNRMAYAANHPCYLDCLVRKCDIFAYCSSGCRIM